MRRFWIILVTMLFVAAGVSAPRALSASASGHSHSMADGKKCKKGQHRVHSRCKKKQSVAPKPTPSPTPIPKPVAYVAIGTSLTRGYGATNPETESFPALLARHLPPADGFLNLGLDGATASDAVGFELPQTLAAHPRIATVWLGTNEVYEQNGDAPPTIGDFTSAMDSILKALQQSHIQVFIANLPDFTVEPKFASDKSGVYARFGLAENAAITSLAARYGDTVIDIYSASKALWGNPATVNTDGQHLNAAGYAAVADLFYGVMHAQGALP